MRIIGVLSLLLAILVFIGTSPGERPNVKAPTFGGTQFWNDEIWQSGWRVQRNTNTNHCRLIDPDNIRHTWGVKSECEDALRTRASTHEIPANPKHLVVLIHGLGGYDWTFRTMRPALEENGFKTLLWNYASTQNSLAEHVSSFHQIMANLQGVEQVDFVAHSLGGLILRTALANTNQSWRQSIKVGQIFLIGSPQNGAELANRFNDHQLIKSLPETITYNLTTEYAHKLPALMEKHFIIAGRLENGGNPIITGDDDGMVAVEETMLNGRKPDLIISANHALLTASPTVIEFTISKLKQN